MSKKGYMKHILGGIDPYSASKASAEIFNSYFKTYIENKKNLRLCTARQKMLSEEVIGPVILIPSNERVVKWKLT